MDINKIAIITTTYNDSQCIGKLFRSLLKQTNHGFTHYILEDGSVNGSEKEVEQYVKDNKLLINPHKIIYMVNNKNVGINKAHQIMFETIEEEYFCWIDSDDWVSSRFIETLTKTIERNNDVDVFHINSKQYDEDGNIVKPSTGKSFKKWVVGDHDQFPAYCLGGERFWHHFLIKTKTFRNINPSSAIISINREPEVWYDEQLLFEMAIAHSTFFYIKKPLSNICNRNLSPSRSLAKNYSEANVEDNKIVCFEKIISNMNISKENIDFYYKMLPFRNNLKEIIANFICGDGDKAAHDLRVAKKEIRRFKLHKNYILYNNDFTYLIRRHYYQKIIGLIKRPIYHFKRKVLFFVSHFMKKMSVMDRDETIEYILKNKCSLSRFGNGEMDIMLGDSKKFQRYDLKLSNELRNVKTNDKLLLCVPKLLEDKVIRNQHNNKFYKNHRKETLFYWRLFFNKNSIMGDSCLTRFYIDYINKDGLGEYVSKLKKLWDKRNVVFIEGKHTRLGVGNDLFNNANTIKRIICPSENAYMVIDSIVNYTINNVNSDSLIIIALGPTASVLAMRLSEYNYQALDLGHIDIEYEWYKMGVDHKTIVEGKYVNEVNGGENPNDSILNEQYYDEIIAEIKL